MPIPCATCHEPIEPDAAECPHCGDSKMTAGRYKQYLYLWLPVVAGIAGIVLFSLMEASSPVVTPWWLLGTIGFAYLFGAIWARSQRAERVDWLEEHYSGRS